MNKPAFLKKFLAWAEEQGIELIPLQEPWQPGMVRRDYSEIIDSFFAEGN